MKVDLSKLPIKLGADPEMFVFDKKLNEFVSAHNLVPGTKAEPYRLDRGSVQLDGTLVEIGIDPASSGEEFRHNLATVIKQVRDMLGSRYELRCGSRVKYSPSVLKGIPQTCFDIGCEPQYIVKDSLKLQKVLAYPAPEGMVFAGGHIHLGFTEGKSSKDTLHLKDCSYVNKGLTRVLAPLMCYGSYSQRDSRQCRNSNVVRIKDYGFEYRRLNSYWLASSRPEKLFKVYMGVLRSIVERAPGPQILGSRSLGLPSRLSESNQCTLPVAHL